MYTLIFSRHLALFAVIASAFGQLHASADNVPSRWPSASERIAATAPGYISPHGAFGECIGRLTLDLPAKIEWPTTLHQPFADPFNHVFSEEIFDAGDAIEIGSVRVAVIKPVNDDSRRAIIRSFPDKRAVDLRTRLALLQSELKDLELKSRKTDADLDSIWAKKRDIDYFSSRLKSSLVDAIDLGIPESYGYGERVSAPNEQHEFSVLHAYLFRGDTVFVFESRVSAASNGAEAAHRERFRSQLQKFRVRKEYEVPRGPGVCVPYGFLPDDGMTPVDIKLSLRFADAKNVLYTIHTGTVTSRALKPTAMLASARAGLGTFGTYDEEALKPSIAERIGPRAVQIGGVKGEQGGVVARIEESKEEQREMYSVFSGYAGWLGVHDMPFMLVDMRTVYGRGGKAGSIANSPFKGSMQRLDYILKGLRYRSSNAAAKSP